MNKLFDFVFISSMILGTSAFLYYAFKNNQINKNK